MNTPQLKGIDHIHVYVNSWEEAELWYGKVLGMRRMESLMSWAVPGGPLTLEDPAGKIHLALFERPDHPDTSATAFGASGEQFLAWREHLESLGIEERLADHELSWSIYFTDPDGNGHEITTYDYQYVTEQLAAS